MPSAAERLEFAPPPQPGMVRSFGLALLAHAALLAALTWGVNWKRQSENAAVEAELWSSIPQQAAPRAVEPPPKPVVAPPPRPEPAQRAADIALERQKKVAEQEKQDKLEKERREAERRREEQLAEKRLEAQRQENLKRIAGLAGASGAPGATGSALQSSSISASYAARIQARIQPHIINSNDFSGELVTDIQVNTAPDGTIVGTPRIVKSSGDKQWDERALRAIIATEVLPRDESGRVPTPMTIGVRPKR